MAQRIDARWGVASLLLLAAALAIPSYIVTQRLARDAAGTDRLLTGGGVIAVLIAIIVGVCGITIMAAQRRKGKPGLMVPIVAMVVATIFLLFVLWVVARANWY